jgi:hypothetical protein
MFIPLLLIVVKDVVVIVKVFAVAVQQTYCDIQELINLLDVE